MAQLTNRLSHDGLAMYENLEERLLTGEIIDALVQYLEIGTPVI